MSKPSKPYIVSSRNNASIDFSLRGSVMDYIESWRRGDEVSQREVPEYIYWNGHLGVDTATKALGDLF